jgi:cellulose synthase/poly-beta-1,6-N-acetylglucosamine synthase-like glycosyltransferase
LLAVWILIGLALLLGLMSLAGDGVRARHVAQSLVVRLPDQECPPATVIVPVKGADEGLASNLAALAALDYPDYELVVTARMLFDIPDGTLPEGARLVIAGAGEEATGEKINNLLAAVRAARPESRMLAFGDSDGQVEPRWLRALAAPLVRDPHTGASTGYRWHIPARPGFWNMARSGWNAVVAGAFGPAGNSFVWGGAMAIRREDFDRARVADYWRGAVSDDFRLAEAVLDSGKRIAFAPAAMVASRDHTTAGEFFDWIVRQMKITRAYRPRLWWMALFGHVIYCGAMVAAAAAAPASLVAIFALGAVKARNRTAIARACFPRDAAWFGDNSFTYLWQTPAVTWIWLYGLLGSALSRRIIWRGRTYLLRRPPKPT